MSFLKTITFEILGITKNDERPKMTIRQNAVEIKLPREHVIFGDIPTTVSGAFYR